VSILKQRRLTGDACVALTNQSKEERFVVRRAELAQYPCTTIERREFLPTLKGFLFTDLFECCQPALLEISHSPKGRVSAQNWAESVTWVARGWLIVLRLLEEKYRSLIWFFRKPAIPPS